jgi:hypothetical protein
MFFRGTLAFPQGKFIAPWEVVFFIKGIFLIPWGTCLGLAFNLFFLGEIIS